MSSTNSKSPPRGSGFMRILQSPNWPWPPVCFLCRPCPSAAPLIVSRYGILRLLEVDLDLVALLQLRPTATSMWSWPCPASSISWVCASRVELQHRVLLHEPVQRRGDLVLVAARLGLDGEGGGAAPGKLTGG